MNNFNSSNGNGAFVVGGETYGLVPSEEDEFNTKGRQFASGIFKQEQAIIERDQREAIKKMREENERLRQTPQTQDPTGEFEAPQEERFTTHQ